MIRKLIILSKQKTGALQLIQISFSSNGDWKGSIRQRIVSFAWLKFAEWRCALTYFAGECFFSISIWISWFRINCKAICSAYLKRWKHKTTLIWHITYKFSIILSFSSILLNSTTNSEFLSPAFFLEMKINKCFFRFSVF